MYFTVNLSIILTKLTGVNTTIVLAYFCGQSLGTYIYMRAAKYHTIVEPVLKLVYNMTLGTVSIAGKITFFHYQILFLLLIFQQSDWLDAG